MTAMSAVLSELANAASLKEGQRTTQEQKEIGLAWFESDRQKKMVIKSPSKCF